MEKRKTFSQRSMLFRILAINIPLLLLLVVIVLGSAVHYNKKIKTQIEQFSYRTLETVHKGVEQEKKRLENLLLLCRSDPSFVLALSTNNRKISASYAVEASSKLSTIKYSLPYAKNVFAHSRIRSQVILSHKDIQSESTFINTLAPQMGEGEKVPDFYQLGNGFHIYENFILYVQELNNYGSIVVQIDPQQFFLAIGGEDLVEYGYAVLAPDKEVFLTSLQESSLELLESYLENPKQSKIQHGGKLYHAIKVEDVLSQYHYVLFYDINSPSVHYTSINIISIATITAIMLLSSLLVLLNAKMYQPLREMVRRLQQTANPKDNKGNEISVIERKITQLSHENQSLTQKVTVYQSLQVEITLKHLLRSQEVPEEANLELLRGSYPYLTLVQVAIQGEDGAFLEQAFRRLDHYVNHTLEGDSLRLDSFTKCYIVPLSTSQLSRERLEGILHNNLLLSAEPIIALVSYSDSYEDITLLHTAWRQAEDRMKGVLLPHNVRKGLFLWKPGQAAEAERIPPDAQNLVANLVLHGTPKEIKDMVHEFLFPEKEVSYQHLSVSYQTLASLVHTIAEIANLETSQQGYIIDQRPTTYHPRYMYDSLVEDYLDINHRYQEKQTNIKYNVTEYIQQHYAKDLHLELLAEVYNLNPSYLSHWFKKNIGLNITEYIADVRIREAKELLKQRDELTVAAIGEKVGFLNTMTFIRQFKGIVGTTPGRYRKQWQQEEWKGETNEG